MLLFTELMLDYTKEKYQILNKCSCLQLREIFTQFPSFFHPSNIILGYDIPPLYGQVTSQKSVLDSLWIYDIIKLPFLYAVFRRRACSGG